MQRLGKNVVDLTGFDSDSVCNWMSKANKFPDLIGAYNGKIENLLTDQVLRNRCSSRVPLMLMFSLSHVHSKVLEIARRGTMPFVSCAYFYNGAKSDGTLIDAPGVKMTRVSCTEALHHRSASHRYRISYYHCSICRIGCKGNTSK